MRTPGVAPYDALLLVSFGGPEGPADVLPFLRNVTRGRAVPSERLEDVAAHYRHFGGRSPINDQCRALLAAVHDDLSRHGIDLPVYWGNRNWDPYLTHAVQRMARDGVRRAACLLTSAYASYAGCRRYREDLYDAVQATPSGAPALDRLRHYFNHPGFVRPFVDGTLDALQRLAAAGRRAPRLVFVTHSIPAAMDRASGPGADPGGGAYARQHAEVARLVAAQVAEELTGRAGRAAGGSPPAYDLVYCSRSGPPGSPWLEPDVNDHLVALGADGAVDSVVLVPIGFVSDHMEVRWDLDTEAAETAHRTGLGFARVPTPGTDPRFVAMVRELLLERAEAERCGAAAQAGDADVPGPTRTALGTLGPSWDVCPAGCCANPGGWRPALCGADAADLEAQR